MYFLKPVFILSDAMTDLDIQELANLTAGDADVEHFERLFSKLKEMKGKWKKHLCNTKGKISRICPLTYFCAFLFALNFEWVKYLFRFFLYFILFQPADKASSMPHEQRKVHAEKVRKDFD